MNFKKRLLILWIAVILTATYYYSYPRTTPSTLAGPSYVDGWNQNTSKNVSHYVSETLAPLIMPKNFCADKGVLLAFIITRPDSFEARNAIRETWARKRNNASFYFLVGEDKNHNYEIQLKLKYESQKYNDLVQERFVDSYNNLTLKSVNMLKLFNLYCSKSHKYLMKIDDDVFLNIDNLFEMFENRKTETNLLLGKLINDTKPYRDPTSKWYVPFELYPEEKYPDYLCGSMYLMSADVAAKLYRCSLETPLFFIEDAYVTGICAKKVNVTPQHHPLITCQELQKYVCLHRKLYAIHYYKPDEIRKSYKILKGDECPPSGSLREWIFSLF